MRLSEPQARGVRVVEIGRLADPEPLLPLLGSQEIPADAGDVPEFAGSYHAVQFRQFFQKIALIALRQAAGGNEDAADSVLFELAMFENRVDGFLFRFFNEAAGIDDDDLGFLGIVG